jgi:GntR family transcriptional regulator
MLESDDYAAV